MCMVDVVNVLKYAPVVLVQVNFVTFPADRKCEPTVINTSTSSPSTGAPSTGTPLCSCVARGRVTAGLLRLCLGFRTLCTLGLSSCVETSSTEEGVEGLCIDNGSTVNKSSLVWVASSVEERRLKGWAGRQIPKRTGASNASATWTSSGIARVDRDWNIRRHFISGWTAPLFGIKTTNNLTNY